MPGAGLIPCSPSSAATYAGSLIGSRASSCGGRSIARRDRADVDRPFAAEVEAVGVDDRDDDVAGGVDELRDLRVVAVAVDEVVRPLHRMLRRGPLAGVMQAELQEDGLAALDVDVARDLDAEDRPAEQAAVRQRDELHEAGMLRRERLELVLVVGEVAVGRAAGGHRAASPPRAASAAAREALRRSVRRFAASSARRSAIADGPAQARADERRRIARVVQHHVGAVPVGALGGVEAEGGEPVAGGRVGRRDGDDPLGARRGGRRRERDGLRAQPRRRGCAGAAACLHDEPLARGDEALRQVGSRRRGGGRDEASGVEVEDGDVPVAARAQGRAQQARGRRRCTARRRRPRLDCRAPAWQGPVVARVAVTVVVRCVAAWAGAAASATRTSATTGASAPSGPESRSLMRLRRLRGAAWPRRPRSRRPCRSALRTGARPGAGPRRAAVGAQWRAVSHQAKARVLAHVAGLRDVDLEDRSAAQPLLELARADERLARLITTRLRGQLGPVQ